MHLHSSARVPPPLIDCQALFARQIETLLELGYESREVRVTISTADGCHTNSFTGSPRRGPPPAPKAEEEPPMPARPPGVPPGARWLSPRSEKVVRALAADPDSWLPAEHLAAACGLDRATHEFRGMLEDLRERGIIDMLQGKGCRLAGGPPPPA